MLVADKAHVTKRKGLLFGVEIETEGVRHLVDVDLDYWKVEHDGSLRHFGLEFIFIEPLKAAAAFKAIDNYAYVAREYEYEHNPRTSVHVHVNVSDLSIRQLYCMLLLSYVVEDKLFNLYGSGRECSNYCVPVRWNPSAIRDVKRFIDIGIEAVIFKSSKYSATSTAKLSHFGTIEYRMFNGTADASVLKKILLKLAVIRRSAIELASYSSYQHLLSMIKELPFVDDSDVDDIYSISHDSISRYNESIRKALGAGAAEQRIAI